MRRLEVGSKAGVPARWWFYVLSLGLFQLGLFAKTAISFLPVSLLLATWWRRERLRWRDIWPLIPMLGIVAVMGGITIYVERHSGGASGQKFSMPLIKRALISGRSFWFYLGKLFFPCRLTFIYERWKMDAGAWWQYVYPAATIGLLAGLWGMRRRLGKGPLAAMMHFYVSTSLLILVVVLYMTRYSFVSDHWQYFGCMSVMALAAAGITTALDRFENKRPFLKPALCGALLLALGWLTWRQCGMYANIETLWQKTLARNPACWLAHNNLGSSLLKEGKVDAAMVHIQQAMKIQPDYPENYINLGDALMQKDRADEAIAQYQKAVEIQPDYPDAQTKLGIALFKKGRVDEAIARFQKALEISPGDPIASFNLTHMAWVLATSPVASVRNGIKAIALVEQVERFSKGRSPLILETLATAYAETGRFSEAIATAKRAQQLAVRQGNAPTADILGRQIKLYQAGTPYRDTNINIAPTPLVSP